MASRSDTEAPPPTWTVWPCEYGGVQVEPGRVPPHHQCAVCGERPIAVVPRHELVDVIGRLANESLKRKSVEAERKRLKEAIASALTSLATGPMKDGYAYAVLNEALTGTETQTSQTVAVDSRAVASVPPESSHGSEDTDGD